MNITGIGGRLATLLAVACLAIASAGPVSAADGDSTPGVVVTAVNPGTSSLGSDLTIVLAAGTEKSTLEAPSCRPQDDTLDCWGSLVLRIPDAGGLSVQAFEVHRVAVGDIACGDEGEDDDCGDHEMSLAAAGSPTGPVFAQVNGVAVLKNPGDSGLPAGTKVQLKLTLTDNGPVRYGDQVIVQINEFAPGSVKPLIVQTEAETIQQVRVLGPR